MKPITVSSEAKIKIGTTELRSTLFFGQMLLQTWCSAKLNSHGCKKKVWHIILKE